MNHAAQSVWKCGVRLSCWWCVEWVTFKVCLTVLINEMCYTHTNIQTARPVSSHFSLSVLQSCVKLENNSDDIKHTTCEWARTTSRSGEVRQGHHGNSHRCAKDQELVVGGDWGGEVILHYLGNKWVYCHRSVGLSKVLICARRRPPSGVEISFMATTSKLRLANLSVFNLTLWSTMFVCFSCRSFLSSSLRLSLLKHHNWCSTYVGLVVLMFGFSLT